jgi:P27 family predicted phage terminase small subunit
MQRGRKPKPVAVLQLEGAYRTSRHARRRAEPEGGGELADVRPPEWMTASQKRVWRQILKDAPKGILRKADRTTFRNYVIAAERFETAARMQNQLDETATTPLLLKGSAGLMISPYIRVMDRTTIIMTQLGAELGFTPTARARLGQPQPREPSEDNAAWAELGRFPRLVGGKIA